VREPEIKGSKKNKFSPPVLKVPRQCPFILMVEVSLTEGKTLGSEMVMF
jgi:hypothetical protein